MRLSVHLSLCQHIRKQIWEGKGLLQRKTRKPRDCQTCFTRVSSIDRSTVIDRVYWISTKWSPRCGTSRNTKGVEQAFQRLPWGLYPILSHNPLLYNKWRSRLSVCSCVRPLVCQLIQNRIWGRGGRPQRKALEHMMFVRQASQQLSCIYRPVIIDWFYWFSQIEQLGCKPQWRLV